MATETSKERKRDEVNDDEKREDTLDLKKWKDEVAAAWVKQLNSQPSVNGISDVELADIHREFDEELAAGSVEEAARRTRCSVQARFLRRQSDDAAARACRTRLMSLGLASQLASLARPSDREPTPTPGLAHLLDEIQQVSRAAASEADQAGELYQEVVDLVDPGLSPEAVEVDLLVHSVAATAAAREAERLTRALAQLVMGVTSCSGEEDEVYDLERAAVAVLHPPKGLGVPVALYDDGMSFVASSEDELSVELAGMICRLLIDRGTRARLAVSGKPGEVLIDVDDEDALLVSTPVPGDEGKAALLADAGWTESPQGGRLVRRLLSPVVVITPAALATRALFRVLGLENAGQLVLALEDRRAVAEPPEQMAARQEL